MHYNFWGKKSIENNIIKKGLVVVVILLFIGVAFASSINANVGKLNEDISQENDAIPVELEYKRIIELVKTINLHKFLFDIDAVVDTLEEISTMLEENDDLRAYIQMQSDNCGCSDESSELEWNFPVLCILLYPLFIISFIISVMSNSVFYFIEILTNIGMALNCFWYRAVVP